MPQAHPQKDPVPEAVPTMLIVLPPQPGRTPKVAKQMVGLISGLGSDHGPHVSSGTSLNDKE